MPPRGRAAVGSTAVLATFWLLLAAGVGFVHSAAVPAPSALQLHVVPIDNPAAVTNGSRRLQGCPAGRFASSGSCLPCTRGHYCTGGVERPCPAGRYGFTAELAAADCTDVCAAGTFCAPGTADPLGEPCGDAGVYCPEATVARLVAPPGRYTVSAGGALSQPSRRVAAVSCPPGHFCVNGTLSPCDGGTFNPHMRRSAACSQLCPAGRQCPPGSALPQGCPPGAYATGEGNPWCAPCFEGHYCETNSTVPTLCPAGRYGDAASMTTDTCSGPCSAGYFCSPGSQQPAGVECGGDDALYCPAGTDTRLTVPPGHYSTGGSSGTRSGVEPCTPGTYCNAGVQLACPAGRYGNASELASDHCSGLCRAGYRCPEQSSTDSKLPCAASPAQFCPPGSHSATPVTVGHYTVPEVGDGTHRHDQKVCPSGSYCTLGVRHACAPGRFSSSPGRDAPCSELCAAGFLCDEPGSALATPPSKLCTDPEWFCPAGATTAEEVPGGSYAVADAVSGGFVNATVCPPGSYCVGGVRQLCPPGRYNPAPGAAGTASCLACAAGYTCPAGSTSATQQPCGVGMYCGAASGPQDARVVSPGHYAVGDTNTTSTAEAPCVAGTYCVGGVRHLCPAGRYGADALLTSRGCSGPCAPGYFCPEASTSDVARPCGDHTTYCPQGSGAPVPVSPGFTPVCHDNDLTQEYCFAETPCEPGHFCLDGVLVECPAGRFGCSTHLHDPLCNGPCAAGFYCDAASTSAVQHKCGTGVDVPQTVYCPSNSSQPTVVDVGFYTLGGNSSAEAARQAPCPEGHYCQQGTAFLCPAGRYGATTRLASANCSGVCAKGHVCRPGSSVPDPQPCPLGWFCAGGQQTPCPAGRWGADLRLVTADDCTPCGAGTYNPTAGANTSTACVPCAHATEWSLADAHDCWPGLQEVVASDPPPVTAGHSVGDVVDVVFSKPTTAPDVSSFDLLSSVVAFAPPIGDDLVGLWLQDDTLLRVTVVNVGDVPLNPDAVDIGRVNVTLLPGLQSRGGLSQPHPGDVVPVAGTWGVPSAPSVVSAEARNTGLQGGLGPGDSLVIRFDQRVTQLPVAHPADLDGLLLWEAAPWSEAQGEWLGDDVLAVTFTAFPPGGMLSATDSLRTAVGNMTFSVRPAAGLRSINGESQPSNATWRVVEGTWGDAPAHMALHVESGSVVRAVVSPPTTNFGYTIAWYRLQWSTDAGFAVGVASQDVAAPPADAQLVYRITGLTPNATYFVRAAASADATSFGPFRNGDAGVTPLFATISGVVPVGLGTRMATAGGQVLAITGTTLGVAASTVRLTYANGRFQYNAGRCAVVTDAVLLHCTTVTGVGADFQFTVWVDGVPSLPAPTLTVSYERPSLAGFQGLACQAGPTPGQAWCTVFGRSFGVRSEDVDAVMYQSQGAPGFVFHATNCTVSTPNAAITCLTAAGAARNHEWSITVGGQNSSSANTFYAPPAITALHRVDGGSLHALATAGGDEVDVFGTNFGPDVRFVDRVTYAAAGGRSFVANCTLHVPHRVLRCRTAPGIGGSYHWQVEVGSQPSACSLQTVSYAGPSVFSVAPEAAAVTTRGDNVVVVGTNFGDEAGAVEVWFDGARLNTVRLLAAHTTLGFLSPPTDQAVVFVEVCVLSLCDNSTLPIQPPTILRISLPLAHPDDLFDVVGVAPNVRRRLRAPHHALEAGVDDAGNWRLLQADGTDDGAEEFVVYVELFGESFGSGAYTNVTIGHRPCLKYAFSHGLLQCVGFVRLGDLVVTRDPPPNPLVAAAALSAAAAPPPSNTSMEFNFESILGSPFVQRVTVLEPAGEPDGSFTVPTTGGVLKLHGEHFKTTGTLEVLQPAPGATTTDDVVVSDLAVQALNWTDTSIVVVVPPGQGTTFRFRVTARKVLGAPSAVFVSYKPPELTTWGPRSGPTPGAALELRGANFGLRGNVTVGDKLCLVQEWSHTLIRCNAQPNTLEAAEVFVEVGGQTSSRFPPQLFQYLPPEVTAVFPPEPMETIGGQTLRVVGNNFGSSSLRVHLTRVFDDGVTYTYPCIVFDPSPTELRCTTTAGGGSDLVVVVENGVPGGPTQSSNSTLTVSYAPPIVTRVVALSELDTTYPPAFAAGAVVSHRPAAPHDADPSQHVFLLHVAGENFAQAASVTVGGVPCEVASHDLAAGPLQGAAAPFSAVGVDPNGNPFAPTHGTVVCVAPPMRARGQAPVVVSALGLASAPFHGFTYDAPMVALVEPNEVDATAQTHLEVFGINFGQVLPTEPHVVLAGGEYPCSDPQWVSDTQLTCTLSSPTGALVAGDHDLEVALFNQTSAATVSITAQCYPGSYGTTGEQCVRCDNIVGAVCPGYGTDPYPEPGFFRAERALMVGCLPPQACVGGPDSGCAPAYTGDACSECAVQHYRLQTRCVPCPDLAWLLFLGFFVVVVLVGAMAYWVTKKKINLVGLSIGVDFIQIVSMFAAFDFEWPIAVRRMYSSASAMNFNIEILAPECSVSWSYPQKFFIIESIPLVVFASVLVVLPLAAAKPYTARGLRWCARTCRQDRRAAAVAASPRSPKASEGGFASVVDNLVGIMFTSMHFTYFVVVKTALGVFDCVRNEKGEEVLDGDPSVRCDERGGPYDLVQPWAIAALVVYGVGIPVAFAVVLFTYRRPIRADQALRAKGKGNTDLTNPQFWVRRRYRKLYEDFKPKATAWRLVLMARKFMLAWATIMFNENAMFQASFSVFVLFFAYVLHARTQPFLSRKAMNEDFTLLHAGSRDHNLTTARAKIRQSIVVMAALANKRTVAFVFNYNSLEAAFLISAMFILLSGMMFDSAAFPIGSPGYIFLTVVVFVLVIGSLVTFTGLLSFEMFRAVKFAAVHRRAEKYERERALADHRRAEEEANRGAVVSSSTFTLRRAAVGTSAAHSGPTERKATPGGVPLVDRWATVACDGGDEPPAIATMNPLRTRRPTVISPNPLRRDDAAAARRRSSGRMMSLPGGAHMFTNPLAAGGPSTVLPPAAVSSPVAASAGGAATAPPSTTASGATPLTPERQSHLLRFQVPFAARREAARAKRLARVGSSRTAFAPGRVGSRPLPVAAAALNSPPTTTVEPADGVSDGFVPGPPLPFTPTPPHTPPPLRTDDLGVPEFDSDSSDSSDGGLGFEPGPPPAFTATPPRTPPPVDHGATPTVVPSVGPSAAQPPPPRPLARADRMRIAAQTRRGGGGGAHPTTSTPTIGGDSNAERRRRLSLLVSSW